jgi:heat shock protein HtpX
MNYFKTFVLMFALILLFMLIGQVIGGRSGMMIALVFAFIMNFFAYWFSDKVVLMMYRAKEISEQEGKDIYKIVRNLTTKANIPMPKIYMLPIGVPNAFATGRNINHAVVAVSPELVNILSKDELESVLAHELTHIRNRDILISTIAACLAGAISSIAHMAQFAAFFGGLGNRDDEDHGGGNIVGLIVMSIIAPLIAILIQLAISRSREYLADEGAAELTNRPISLANALKKISDAAKAMPLVNASPSSAHLFIVNPMKESFIANMFSTHPSLGRRVARLEKIAGKMTGVWS